MRKLMTKIYYALLIVSTAVILLSYVLAGALESEAEYAGCRRNRRHCAS